VAQLEARLGGQAVYDIDRGFTVTADANLPLTHRFGVSGINADGSMTWVTAQSWIDALNASNYLGFNDWRLPSGRADGGNYCTQMPECSNGELYHLWLELGGSSVGAGDITGSTDPDLALFFNFPNEYYKFYWEGTLNTRGRAWAYSFGQTSGTRHRVYDRAKAGFIFVWPVRDGDVVLETAGDSGFHNPQDDSEYSWLAQSGVDGFQVSRSSEARFDFDCSSWQTPSLMIHDADTPAAGTVLFYLNRPQSPDPGSWGHGSSGGTRTGNCL